MRNGDDKSRGLDPLSDSYWWLVSVTRYSQILVNMVRDVMARAITDPLIRGIFHGRGAQNHKIVECANRFIRPQKSMAN